MATSPTHYDTLELPPTATQEDIKQAYRRLAKKFHPDRNSSAACQETFKRVSAAYEVLADPLSRRSYDQQLRYVPTVNFSDRQSRSETAQSSYRQQRQTEKDGDDQLRHWLNRVYTPVNRFLNQIIKPLRGQIKELSADPFDDELMEAFQAYVETSRSALEKSQTVFKSLPNPPMAAGAAAHLYYCMNQLGDALDELDYFSQNYDETYLHTGYEMFRIAEGLRKDAQVAVRSLR
ncbi:J domain-containing protein [Alkalinema pantanalense CENA528]|uniref:J domain-containing protein n=1 Tax=Alkalinema pantanalense TaxID=1620705 RepID=UPI003D6E9217